MPRNPNTPCSSCGNLCWPSKRKDYRAPAEHICHACRRSAPGYRIKGMATAGVIYQWACAGCGAACERIATRGQRPKWCIQCRVMRANRLVRVTPQVRLEIYQRDGWTCWLCEEPVDRALIGSRDHWRPSLDHVTTRVAGGSDDPTNLRLAHWWCNSVRSDGRAYEPADFRAA